jgi:hypothetical protein
MQALEQLDIATFLTLKGWPCEQIQLALTHIISRATYPASELRTSECPPDRTGRDKRKLSSL